MTLTELKPHWIEFQGRKVAMIFLCPHCVIKGSTAPRWLSCFFVPERIFPTPNMEGRYADQYDLLRDTMRKFGLKGDDATVVGCKPGVVWTRTSDDFATMSVTPSLDASPSGDWHGVIMNGNVN